MPSSTPRRRVRRALARPRLEALEPRSLLATFTVTSLDDAGPGTLREAIERADLDPAQDTIEFAPRLSGTIALSSALPDVTADLLLRGPGDGSLAVAYDDFLAAPPLRVTAGTEVTMTGLALPGGIENDGTLTIADSTVSGRTGSVYGGLYNTGTLTVTGSTISGNRAFGRFSLDVGFIGDGAGGGILNEGTLTVVDSTLSGNKAVVGGGIANRGTATITNATISGNDAAGSFMRYSADKVVPVIGLGGAILNEGTVTVADATLSGNEAHTVGGADGNGGGIANRRGGVATLVGSIFANSMGNLVNVDGDGQFRSTGHNIISDAPEVPLDSTDRTATDPLLGPLADNGGPTLTHALLPGSPAIDAGVAVAGVTTDQRGVHRPRGLAPDVGAFELEQTFPPADFDGDGTSDRAIYTYDPAAGFGRFEIAASAGGSRSIAFGGADDVPLVGDYDGDGLADVAVYGYSPLDGVNRLALIRSSDGQARAVPFGGPGDVPVVGDFDGDGIDDLAVYGPGPDGVARFAVLPSSDPNGAYAVPIGGPGDTPLAGDYDGDGLADLAVYGVGPDGVGRFAIRPSSDPSSFVRVAFGGPDDRPVVGDYDGDGTTDIAVYGFSPLDGFSRFAILPSGLNDPTFSAARGAYPVAFGGPDDRPVAADYDGDGTTDIAVYGFSPLDEATRFAILRSSDGRAIAAAMGTPESIGLPAPPGQPRPTTTRAS